MKIITQHFASLFAAVLLPMVFGLGGCASDVAPRETATAAVASASSPVTAPAMDYLDALKRIQSVGAITIGGSWAFIGLKETPSANESRLRLKFTDGSTYDCRYADTPAPAVNHKLFAQPPTKVTIKAGGEDINIWNSEEDSKSWVMAWRILANGGSEQTDEGKAAFAKVVREFRASSPKPMLSEETRMFKVQAARAVKDQNLWEAAHKFRQALEIAPWWPEGHFNLALISAELGLFKYATHSMERYLQLVPDAPDARAARDKIYEWKGLQ